MKGNTHSTTYQFSEGSQVIGQFRLHSSDFFSNMSKLYSRKSVIYQMKSIFKLYKHKLYRNVWSTLSIL